MIDNHIYNGNINGTSLCGNDMHMGSRNLMDRNADCNTCPNDEETYVLEDNMEDFDPSLFCPDIIMELGDVPIEISNDALVNGLEKCNGSLDRDDCNISKKEENEHPVQYTKIHCTSCNQHLGSAVSNHHNVRVHPLLKVLICKDCYEFYLSGEFGKDEDGSEMYCRWCGEGGQVICCSSCEYVFCTKCIRRNLGRKELADIKSKDDWTCFKCDQSQLISVRAHCAEFMEYIERQRLRAFTLEKDLFEKDYSECCSVKTPVRKRKRKSSDDEKDLDYSPFEGERNRFSTSSTKRTPRALTTTYLAPTPPVLSINPPQFISSNATITDALNLIPKIDRFLSKPCLLPPPSLNKQYTPIDPLKLTTSTKQILTLAKKDVPTFLPKNNIRSVGFPSVNPRETKIPPYNVKSKRDVYAKFVRLAGRISSDLSISLNRLSGDRLYVCSLEEAVNVHNQIQETLNTAINSLLNLKKSLMEARPESERVGNLLGNSSRLPNKGLINYRDKPPLQHHAISSTKSCIKPDLTPNVSLFKCLNKKKILIQKKVVGTKFNTVNTKNDDNIDETNLSSRFVQNDSIYVD